MRIRLLFGNNACPPQQAVSSKKTGTLSNVPTFASPGPRITPSHNRGVMNSAFMDGLGSDATQCLIAHTMQPSQDTVQVEEGADTCGATSSRCPECALCPTACNWSLQRNHLEGLLKCRSPGTAPRVSASVGLSGAGNYISSGVLGDAEAPGTGTPFQQPPF